MSIGILQADPFPIPEHAGQEIENIGLMFAHFSMLIFLIILMIYLVVKLRKDLPIIVVYLLSLVIGMLSLQDSFIPCNPYFQVLFLLLQTSLFVEFVLDKYNIRKR